MDYAAARGWCDVVIRRWVYRVIADTRKLKEVLHTTKGKSWRGDGGATPGETSLVGLAGHVKPAFNTNCIFKL